MSIGSVAISGEINEGWGRQTWGYGVWGAGGIDVALTGTSIQSLIGDEGVEGDVDVTAPTLTITSALGTAFGGANIEVAVTGQSITTSMSDVNAALWTEINANVSMVWTEIAA